MDPKLRMEYRVDMDGRVYRFRDTPSPDGSQDGPEHSGLREMQHSRSMNLTPPRKFFHLMHSILQHLQSISDGDQNLSQLAGPKPPGREADPILPEKQADSRTQASSSHVGSRKRRNSSSSSDSSSEVKRSALVRGKCKTECFFFQINQFSDYIPPAFDDYQTPQGLYNAIDFHNAMSKSLESYAKHMGIKRPYRAGSLKKKLFCPIFSQQKILTKI
ncbi:hypothetical protein CAEBREN_20133 [Caenorhabditis brenneri]|uniref:Uncharacterized protein n=1 Tax=Caenorhabditis brenneri TaxID=135651 RepID=G0N1P8_CAEBE|nr:hypothetical protein CAEBREN_20133 [Caenorhabditis brenneri]